MYSNTEIGDKTPKKSYREPPLDITEEEGVELLNWFEDEDLLKVSMAGTFHNIRREKLSKLVRKAKEMRCPPTKLFNFIKSRRRYFTTFLSKSQRSGSGESH